MTENLNFQGPFNRYQEELGYDNYMKILPLFQKQLIEKIVVSGRDL